MDQNTPYNQTLTIQLSEILGDNSLRYRMLLHEKREHPNKAGTFGGARL